MFSIFDTIGNPDYVLSETSYKELQVQQQPTKSHHELTAAQRQTKIEAFSIFDDIGLS
jgi:hypothetical protein